MCVRYIRIQWRIHIAVLHIFILKCLKWKLYMHSVTNVSLFIWSKMLGGLFYCNTALKVERWSFLKTLYQSVDCRNIAFCRVYKLSVHDFVSVCQVKVHRFLFLVLHPFLCAKWVNNFCHSYCTPHFYSFCLSWFLLKIILILEVTFCAFYFWWFITFLH